MVRYEGTKMTEKGKTLTISTQNHLELCKLKLDMQSIAKNKVRINFDIVLEYLLTQHTKGIKTHDLQKYVKLVLKQ